MTDIGTLIDFTDGDVLYAAQLDSNFGDIRTAFNTYAIQTNKASQVITKTVTFTPDAGVGFTVSTGGATISAGGFTVTAGGITVTAGGLSVAAGTTAVQALTCTTLAPSGTSTLQAVTCTTLNASGNITGTLATAAQGNITSLGTLTALTVSGTLTLSNASPLSLASTSKFVVGATSFTIKDSGDGVEAFKLTGTGTSSTVTINSGSSGGVTLTGNSSNTVILSSSNTRLNANNGLILLGTDGTNPISGTATLGFPVMPYTSGAPTGILSSSKIGSFQLDDSNKRLYVWTGLGWYYTALTP